MSGNKRWYSSQYDDDSDDWSNQQSSNKKQAYQSPKQHTPQLSNYGGHGTPQTYPVRLDEQNWRGRSSCDPPRTSQQMSFPSMQERSHDSVRSPQFSLPFLQDQGNETARSSYSNSQNRGNSTFPSIQDRAGTRGQNSGVPSTFPTLQEASQFLLQQNMFPDSFRSLPAMGQPNVVVKQEQQQDRTYNMQQNRNFPAMDQARMRVKQETEEDMHQEQATITTAGNQETNRSFPAMDQARVKQEPGTSRNQKPTEEEAESSDSTDLDDLDEFDDHVSNSDPDHVWHTLLCAKLCEIWACAKQSTAAGSAINPTRAAPELFSCLPTSTQKQVKDLMGINLLFKQHHYSISVHTASLDVVNTTLTACSRSG
ncbi:hypothetical protein B566_EDAN015787, partial [Ephemera danica]